MKKKGMLLIAVILLSTAGLTQAKEGGLSGTVDFTFMSRYIWRGFDFYNNNDCGIKTGLDLDLYGTGLGFNIFHARSTGKNFENLQWIPINLYYQNTLFGEAAYATNYRLGWVYYYFPASGRSGDPVTGAGDLQEIHACFSWPKICPVTGLVPTYTVCLLWPSASGSTASTWGGWAHLMGLRYDLKVPGFIPDTPEQILHLSANLCYNGGVGPRPPGGVVDHDWSHFVLGMSTDFDLPSNITFTPGFYYQASMESSVNTQDEWWVTLSMAYKF